jgi:hypothetical protein
MDGEYSSIDRSVGAEQKSSMRQSDNEPRKERHEKEKKRRASKRESIAFSKLMAEQRRPFILTRKTMCFLELYRKCAFTVYIWCYTVTNNFIVLISTWDVCILIRITSTYIIGNTMKIKNEAITQKHFVGVGGVAGN